MEKTGEVCLDDAKLVKWVSNDGQITEKGQSHGRKANFLPSLVGDVYDWLRVGGHLGNVGLAYMRKSNSE